MFLFSNSYCLKNIVPLDYLYLHLNVHGTYYIQRTSSFFIQHRTLKFLWLFHHHDSNSEKRDASVFREWTESSVQCHAISYRPLLLMLVELSSDGSLVACSVRHGLENWYPEFYFVVSLWKFRRTITGLKTLCIIMHIQYVLCEINLIKHIVMLAKITYNWKCPAEEKNIFFPPCWKLRHNFSIRCQELLRNTNQTFIKKYFCSFVILVEN